MPGAGDGEQRHRLGEAVDRGAPLLVEQQQDGRDQRAGVADADPPDEVDDREAPADRDVDAPDADALDEQPGDGRSGAPSTSRNADAEADEPAARRAVASGRSTLILSVTDAERVARRDDRRLGRRRRAARDRVSRRPSCAGARGSRRLGDLGVRVADAPPGRSCAAACSSSASSAVVARLGLQLRDAAVRVVEVAEDDRLASGRPPGRRSRSRRRGSAGPRFSASIFAPVDALHAVGALLHHAAAAHRHVGVAHAA